MEQKDEKRMTRKRAVMDLVFFIVTDLAILACVAFSLGWFVNRQNADADGMTVSMHKPESDYDLFAVGENAGKYEVLLRQMGVATDGTDTILNGQNGASTADRKSVYWRIASDSNINNYSEATGTDLKLKPGDSGKISFAVISNREGELNVDLTLSLEGYKARTGGVDPVTDEINKLLSGHVFFFKNYTDGKYSEYLRDGEFSMSDSGSYKGKTYEYTLYWYWPRKMSDIIATDQTTVSTSDSTKDTITSMVISDAASMASATDYDSSFFRYTNGSIVAGVVTQSTVASLTKDSPEAETIDIFYNLADQAIGMNVDYLLLRLGDLGEDGT